MRATVIPPPGGQTGGVLPGPNPLPRSADPGRKPRCLRLIERTNGIRVKPAEQCASERLPGSALCAHHLSEAAREFQAIVAAHTLGASRDIPATPSRDSRATRRATPGKETP